MPQPPEPRMLLQLLGRAMSLLKVAKSIYPEGDLAADGFALTQKQFLDDLVKLGVEEE